MHDQTASPSIARPDDMDCDFVNRAFHGNDVAAILAGNRRP
jgi:hypothetical protein